LACSLCPSGLGLIRGRATGRYGGRCREAENRYLRAGVTWFPPAIGNHLVTSLTVQVLTPAQIPAFDAVKNEMAIP